MEIGSTCDTIGHFPNRGSAELFQKIFQQSNRLFLIIAAVYVALFLAIPHTELVPADPGIKIIQVRDFIASGFRSFQAAYPGAPADPALEFFPVKAPFAYIHEGAVYYVFPFFLTLLYTPFYLIGGVFGVTILSLFAGLGCLALLIALGRRFALSPSAIFWMALCFAIGSSAPLHSLMPGEMMLSAFSITAGVYFVIRGLDTANWRWYLLAGLCCGSSVFLRVGTALLGVLIFIAIVFWFGPRMRRDQALHVVSFGAGLGVFGLILIAANSAIVGEALGLRGIQVDQTVSPATIGVRLQGYVTYYLFSCGGVGMFVAWPALLFFLAAPFVLRKHAALACVVFPVVAVYCLAIPVLITINDGSIYGPRYLMPVQPLLTLLAFAVLDRLVFAHAGRRIAKMAVRGAVVYSMLWTVLATFTLIQFNRYSRELNERIAREADGTAVVLKSWDLYGSALALMRDRPVYAPAPETDHRAAIAACQRAGHSNISVIQFDGEQPADPPKNALGCPVWLPLQIEVVSAESLLK